MDTVITGQEKINALANFLELTEEETKEIVAEDGFGLYSYGNQEYLVLTDKQADEKAKEEIRESLWAFKADFIMTHCHNYESMDCYEYEQAVKSLRKAQESSCESLNGLVFALIDDFDEFVADAIDSDGRGHFLSHYDGEENEEDDFYIYRVG
jgi:hypothetical protein